MATDARAIRTLEVTVPDWKTVKAWAKATFAKQRIAELALCVSTVTVLGVVLFSLHRAMENYIILGF